MYKCVHIQRYSMASPVLPGPARRHLLQQRCLPAGEARALVREQLAPAKHNIQNTFRTSICISMHIDAPSMPQACIYAKRSAQAIP